MPAIDPLYIVTTIINRYFNEICKGSATGFFFIDDQKRLYVVTNKHVIYGKDYHQNSDPEINKIKLNLHTNPQDLSQNEEIIINLFDGDDKKWLEHSNKEVDVILIPVDIDTKRFVIKAIDKSLIEVPNIELSFEKIFVMGYPYGWYDTVNNLPVTRIGHLSSPFKVPFQGKPIMLGDVETHPGMSGGPVLMKVKDYVTIEENKRNTHLGASKLILVGIHSGQPKWELLDRNGQIVETISHTLINIWSSDLILEILRQNKE